jgi:hypothetical protein
VREELFAKPQQQQSLEIDSRECDVKGRGYWVGLVGSVKLGLGLGPLHLKLFFLGFGLPLDIWIFGTYLFPTLLMGHPHR